MRHAICSFVTRETAEATRPAWAVLADRDLGEVLHARGEHVCGFNGQLLAATCTSAAEPRDMPLSLAVARILLACKQAKAGGAPLRGVETNYRATPPVQLEEADSVRPL
jgi:hypothetical protein